VKPEDADKVIAALKKIVAEMRSGDISDDEFSRAIMPSLEVLPQNAASNGYWLNLISQAQTRPDVMERNKLSAIEKSVRAVTKADVVAAANRWLSDAAAQDVRVMPSKKAVD
jgi:zinc protease